MSWLFEFVYNFYKVPTSTNTYDHDWNIHYHFKSKKQIYSSTIPSRFAAALKKEMFRRPTARFQNNIFHSTSTAQIGISSILPWSTENWAAPRVRRLHADTPTKRSRYAGSHEKTRHAIVVGVIGVPSIDVFVCVSLREGVLLFRDNFVENWSGPHGLGHRATETCTPVLWNGLEVHRYKAEIL
jgi:hypothetical protein